MNLNQANKKMAVSQAKKEALDFFTQKIENGLSTQMELVMCLVLHDKFGFGQKRCQKALLEFEKLWDCINEQHLTLEDIQETVEKEIGILLKYEL